MDRRYEYKDKNNSVILSNNKCLKFLDSILI